MFAWSMGHAGESVSYAFTTGVLASAAQPFPTYPSRASASLSEASSASTVAIVTAVSK